jgi:hypothetical protein
VDAVSHSPYWASTALFFVEDDSQAGVDHVDGHRSIAFVVSPYVRRGQVNHTYYTQVSMVRTVEELLGLPPMNQHDKLAPSMADVFQDFPDLTPYTALPNQIPLDSLNGSATGRLQRAWRDRLASFFPTGPHQKPDVADPVLLNHAIWYATKGFSTPYPGDHKVMYPNELKPAANRTDRD